MMYISRALGVGGRACRPTAKFMTDHLIQTTDRDYEEESKGGPWIDLRVRIPKRTRKPAVYLFPENTEPELVWLLSGEAVVDERELGGHWLRTTAKKGDFYLTAPGPAYEVKSRSIGPIPVRVFCVTLGLRLMSEAMAEVFGEDASMVHLRDVSGFQDPFMNGLIEKLYAEFRMGQRASRLLVRGIGQTLAIHLARNYSVISETAHASRRGWGLPGFKLRKIADFMAGHIQDGFSLTRLAAEAAMSEFHFSRMFKRTTGKSPSQYFISLRMEKAQALLRETRKEIIEVALDVGYTSPSHFAQVFRRETGRSPLEYRRQL
jgi:AraC family transcriptional regulator